ncbi:peptidoglycan-binding protein [Neptunicella marina]|uniref:Peptidoglycan-binding protein n=1 Tax=Neptunicella marina TaxID=2125989 RepID=A0A8J6ISJ6_9ALTE|nr:peptidoglycan-binding protein [Neptunicella marina]MBC3765991.1 peptidoglycan-binding protein [Neptunicella marina]
MPLLQLGDAGEAVAALQTQLKKLGFYPYTIDGDFGEKTQAAVEAFQQQKQLQVDGKAGHITLGQIEMIVKAAAATPVNIEDITLAQQICIGSDASNVAHHWPIICQSMRRLDLADPLMLLMAMATVYTETGRFCPIDEYKSHYNTSEGGHDFDLYDDRHDLGNQGAPDGALFKGRGYIQLTGRDNYRDIGERLGMGTKLVQQPELANDPIIAADILSMFLKRGETGIRQALTTGNLAKARKKVNGGSHGLQTFTQCFTRGEQLLLA